MEVQLQELVDKIKRDGVQQARTEADEIIKQARETADRIVSEAEESAQAQRTAAQQDAKRFEQASITAIQQASRNTLLLFKDAVIASLNDLIASEVDKAYDTELLKDLIPKAVTEWIKKSDVADSTIILSEDDMNSLKKVFFGALKKELDAGLELCASDSVNKGFHIGVKNGTAYYDFSAEEVANLFSKYLSPKASEILKNAAQEL